MTDIPARDGELPPELVARIGSDPDALEAFYHAHYAPLLRYFTARVNDPHEVADLVADTFLAAMSAAAGYDPARGRPAPARRRGRRAHRGADRRPPAARRHAGAGPRDGRTGVQPGEKADGTYYLEIYRVSGIPAANQRLAEEGISARVYEDIPAGLSVLMTLNESPDDSPTGSPLWSAAGTTVVQGDAPPCVQAGHEWGPIQDPGPAEPSVVPTSRTSMTFAPEPSVTQG